MGPAESIVRATNSNGLKDQREIKGVDQREIKGVGNLFYSLGVMKCRPSPFRVARRPNLSGPVSFRPRLQDNIESPSAGTDNPLERAKFIPIVLRIFVAADG